MFLFSAISWAAAASKPDLKVTELTAVRQSTQAVPLRIEITARIHNSGSGTGAAHFVTRLFYGTKTSDPWQQLYDWTSGAMASGEDLPVLDDVLAFLGFGVFCPAACRIIFLARL